ncbi:hypothetical protein C8Q78DRAFT_1033090 [Trametes maxima]|nr:hypothetical protein C8Q78DRAFT_1033090 [Trametes maxima]
MPSPIVLFVRERCALSPPPTVKTLCFELAVCPTYPLLIGLHVQLHIILASETKLPFLPANVTTPFLALKTEIHRPVTGIRRQGDQCVEYVIQNEAEGAYIHKAHVQVPQIPGLAVPQDVWYAVTRFLENKDIVR